MKKNLLLFAFICCASIAFAQLEVVSNGNVGIGTSTPLSRLTVGTLQGNASSLAYMFSSGKNYTLQISNVAGSAGIYAEALGPGAKTTAIHGIGGSASGSGLIGVGVKGVALKYGYGVSGLLNSSDGLGAGVYGAVGSDEIFPVYGRYAGYFDGNVEVVGTLHASYISGSDIRFKKDIVEPDPEKSLKSILMMRPVEYRLEQRYVDVTAIDSITQTEVTVKHPIYDEESQLFQKKHYGLIAQELQKLYPDLVYEVDNRGYLGINYTEIIPMLIQSVQELNQANQKLSQRIEVLEGTGSVLKNTTGATDVLSVNGESKAALFQNTPNPFSQATQIEYYLPTSVNKALLCIYDLQGKQLKQYPLSQRGEGFQQILGSEFAPGMYLYALIADGTKVDVKQMVLTE